MTHLALELASTIRHDGNGGVLDDLADATGFAAWLDGRVEVDVEHARKRVTVLRRAVRSLFAHAVAPQPPNHADAGNLLDQDVALAMVNAAAAGVPRTPVLDWPTGAKPRLNWTSAEVDAETALLANLARSAIELLTGADRDRLRACPAPRCVRYFVQDHPRQTWCKPSCGNRARVSRYYQRHHEQS
jgi:predicted RNA-binding Zn ribbon-like protein